MALYLFKIILFLTVTESFGGKDCKTKLSTCIHIVQPFLHLHQYMFPVNITDIQNVCKRWSELMECVRLFMKECSTDDRKTKFNDAIRVPVHIVHAICSSEKYQKDYLDIAECFKEVSTNNCGPPYQRMIDKASDPNTEYQDLCCGYTEFQTCVDTPLRVKCGTQAHTLMDQFLAFLVSQCSHLTNSVNSVCMAGTPLTRPTHSVDTSTLREARHLPPTRPVTSRTIIYPMEPTSQSRRSSAISLNFNLCLQVLVIFMLAYRAMCYYS